MSSFEMKHAARFRYLADHFLEIILVVMRNPAQGEKCGLCGASAVVNHSPQE